MYAKMGTKFEIISTILLYKQKFSNSITYIKVTGVILNLKAYSQIEDEISHQNLSPIIDILVLLKAVPSASPPIINKIFQILYQSYRCDFKLKSTVKASSTVHRVSCT